jgi:hypothetical protein
VFWSISDLHDLVACADFTFLNHTAIEAWTLMRDQQSGHLRVIHAYADAIAGNPRLRHFKQRTADAVAIADADLIIGKTFYRQVLAELTVLRVVPLKMLLPVAIGVELIDHYGAVLSAVSCEVALSITIEIETARHYPAGYRLFPYGRSDDSALPFDVARKADIH